MACNSKLKSTQIPRRALLKGALSASALTLITGGKVLTAAPRKTVSPNEKINLACVGIMNRGSNVSGALGGSNLTNVVALCDVNIGAKGAGRICGRFPKAAKFQDFRKMFDKMGDQIDAVSIATPDHSHFPIAMLAMSMGKHVYIEKPLAHTFQEVELIMAAQKKYGVATQMGNQGHCGHNYMQAKTWIEAGIIKNVRRIDASMNNGRRWHGWNVNGYPTGETAPATMDWDTWLATAQPHEYSRRYDPGNWRCWYDFGNGALGDWGPHIIDTLHEFLRLGLPTTLNPAKLDGPNKWIFPQASTIEFDFPARGKMPPVKLTWYDGTKNPAPQPKEFEGRRALRGPGKVVYCDDMVFAGGSHSAILRAYPAAKWAEVKSRVPELPKGGSGHISNFLNACRGEEKCRSSFDVSGPLTQVLLLGVIAQRVGQKFTFDRATKQITDNKIANQLLVGPPPRKGWEQFYKMA